MQSYIQW